MVSTVKETRSHGGSFDIPWETMQSHWYGNCSTARGHDMWLPVGSVTLDITSFLIGSTKSPGHVSKAGPYSETVFDIDSANKCTPIQTETPSQSKRPRNSLARGTCVVTSLKDLGNLP